MKQNFGRVVASILIVVAVIITQSGCRENTILNAKLAPNINNADVLSVTLNAIPKTIYDDSVLTSLNISGLGVYHGLGSINEDAFFGRTNSRSYFQVRPPKAGFSFSGYQIDSAIMIVPYSATSSYYGFTWGDTTDKTASLSYQVYQVTDAMSRDSNYLSYTTKAYDMLNPLSDPVTQNLYYLHDSVDVMGVKKPPHMRIRLKDSFKDLMFNSSSSNFTDYATFLNWFRGFYIQVSDTSKLNKTMPYFRLDENGWGNEYSKANVLFYCHSDGKTDTVTFSFFFDGAYCAHYNKVSRSYSGYPAESYFQNVMPDSGVLLQNQPGAAIDLQIPNICQSILGTATPTAANIRPVINRAELSFTVKQVGDDNVFYAPMKIYAVSVVTSSAGVDSTVNIEDRYPANSTTPLAFIDGYSHGIGGNTVYTINLPREVQKALIQGKDTLHLRINGTRDFYGAYRMQVDNIKLNIVYSKVK